MDFPPRTLTLLPQTLAICRLNPSDDIPAWPIASRFLAITRTPNEISIVCYQQLVPPGVTYEPDWRALETAGPMDFKLTGVLASLLTPLAQAGISVFAISTFDTDYLLVKQDSLPTAIQALESAGHSILQH